MPSCLKIEILGDFRLLRDSQPLMAVATARMQSLLAHLVLHQGASQSRAHVAFLFWPDSSEKQALTNLRHLLHKLRNALPGSDELIQTDHGSLSWNPRALVTLDVADFARALAEAEQALQKSDDAGARHALESAVALYRGELLPSCAEDWIVPQREHLRRDFAGALERLVRVLEDARDYAGALRHAQRLQQLEPTHEATACTLMRLHALAGDRAAALQVYKDCVAVLRRELAVGPGDNLRELHARVLGGEPMPAKAAVGSPSGPRAQELPLRGRHTEWQTLKRTWARASQGHPHLLVILGEAGIGKSRLAEELCMWVERQGGAVARTRSYAAEGRLAFAPAAQWLRSPALRPQLARLDPVWRAEVARILPEEPALARAKPRAPEKAQEGWWRHRLFEGLSRAVLAGRGPLLLLLDDLQWTDQETLEWLRFLLRFAPDARLLVIGTVRIEELNPGHLLHRLLLDLRRDDQSAEIQLGPLSYVEARLVAADVAGRHLSGEEATWLYRETEGNPLFVVEQVRAGLRGLAATAGGQTLAASAAADDPSLPPKVHAVITTRLAQLSPAARELAGVAAVVGRACPFEVLAGVWGRSEDMTVRALEELWQRRILRETGAGVFDFTHDRLRDVAYMEASAPRRRLLHHRAAELLEQRNATNPEPVWAQVAAHFEAAGMPLPALAAYQRAADAAKRVHANEEAIRLFQKALVLLRALPPTSETAGEELGLNTALGACLVASHGYPDPGVWGVYERAIELCRQLGRPTEAPILRALAIASLTSGDLRRSEALGHELLALHAQGRDPIIHVEGHYVLGVSFFWLGRFADARAHLGESLDHYDLRRRDTHISLYAQDPRAICLCRLAWTLWYLGYPEQSQARLDEALALARELRHPNTESYVLSFGAQLCLDMREEPRAAELLETLEKITARHTVVFWEFRQKILTSLQRAASNREMKCIEQAEANMTVFARVGNLVNFSQFLGFKARVYLQCGAIRDGLAAIDEAFALLGRIDERFFNAELHRLRGELLVAQGSAPAEIEACFQQALRLSREQQSKSLELRAAMSLGRLWQAQRKKRQARELVATVYAWFSEGFATADLRDAHALLEQWE